MHDIGKLGELDPFSEVDLVDELFEDQPASETLKSTKKSKTPRLNRLKNFFSFNAKSKNTQNTDVNSNTVSCDAEKIISDAIGVIITSWFATEENPNTMCNDNEFKPFVSGNSVCVPKKPSLRKRIVKGLRRLFRMK